jgi:hypothetical protein
MSGISYAYEKLFSAVGGMASSPLSLQERLEAAYIGFHPIRPEELPAEVGNQYRKIMELLTADKSDAHRGYVPTTTARMTDDQARMVIQMLVTLLDQVARLHFEEQSMHFGRRS